MDASFARRTTFGSAPDGVEAPFAAKHWTSSGSRSLPKEVFHLVHTEEHERFSARLASIPGAELIPSFGAWIVLKVEDPPAFAAWVEERIPGAGLTVPSHLVGAVRIPVRSAKVNEAVQEAVREHFAALAAVDRHLDPM